MTYIRQNSDTLFRAWNTTKQTGVNIGDKFTFQSSVNCTVTSSTDVDGGAAWVYGEIRCSDLGSTRQNYDIVLDSNTSRPSRGWQVWNNSISTYASGDDGVWGVVTSSTAIVLDDGNVLPGQSNIEETRLFGFKVSK